VWQTAYTGLLTQPKIPLTPHIGSYIPYILKYYAARKTDRLNNTTHQECNVVLNDLLIKQ